MIEIGLTVTSIHPDDLMDLAVEYQQAARQTEAGDIPDAEFMHQHGRRMRLAEIAFPGSVARVTALDHEDTPIAAYCRTSGYFIDSEWKIQNGLFLKGHPRRTTGIIESVNFYAGIIQLRPRRLSPYAFDRGRFIVNLLTEDIQPRVDLKIG